MSNGHQFIKLDAELAQLRAQCARQHNELINLRCGAIIAVGLVAVAPEGSGFMPWCIIGVVLFVVVRSILHVASGGRQRQEPVNKPLQRTGRRRASEPLIR